MMDAPNGHPVSEEWRELEQKTAEAKAAAVNDLLAHYENVEPFLSEAALQEGRRFRARMRTERDELLSHPSRLEVVE